MGGHRAGHACARACRCNRAKQSYLVIEIFVGASLLPTPDRMGEALHLTIGLDRGPTMARPPPACRRRFAQSRSFRTSVSAQLRLTPLSRSRNQRADEDV